MLWFKMSVMSGRLKLLKFFENYFVIVLYFIIIIKCNFTLNNGSFNTKQRSSHRWRHLEIINYWCYEYSSQTAEREPTVRRNSVVRTTKLQHISHVEQTARAANHSADIAHMSAHNAEARFSGAGPWHSASALQAAVFSPNKRLVRH